MLQCESRPNVNLNYNLLSGTTPNIMVSEISLTSPYIMDLFYSDESKNPYILLIV